jgi:hypothetical protein
MLPHPKLIFLAGIILLVALATPSLAASLYKWTAEDGSVAFTDDPKRIPERYRSQAKTLKTGGLSTYERFTPSDSARQSEHQALLQERLERLRETNRVDRAVAPQDAAKGPASETILQVNDKFAVRIPTASSDEAPIIVEEVRVRDPNSIVTRHVTVVRQGDRVISVIKRDGQHSPGYPYRDNDFE